MQQYGEEGPPPDHGCPEGLPGCRRVAPAPTLCPAGTQSSPQGRQHAVFSRTGLWGPAHPACPDHRRRQATSGEILKAIRTAKPLPTFQKLVNNL